MIIFVYLQKIICVMKKVSRIPNTASFLFDSCDFTGSVCKVYSCGDNLYLKMDGNIYRMTKEDVESLSGRIVNYVQDFEQVTAEESS